MYNKEQYLELVNKLNKYKPGKSKRMPLSMFIRYNENILYFKKYFYIKNGGRI